MTEVQRQLAWDLVVKTNGKSDISREEFLARFPSAVEGGTLAPTLLLEAARARSAEDLTAALVIGSAFGFSAEHVPLLCQLLHEDWHFEHENIVLTFQHLKDARSVDALYRAALVSHGYLAFDDTFGLARKCTWTLADIGTSEAKSKLEVLAKSENPEIASYARKRLDRWDDELHPKKG